MSDQGTNATGAKAERILEAATPDERMERILSAPVLQPHTPAWGRQPTSAASVQPVWGQQLFPKWNHPPTTEHARAAWNPPPTSAPSDPGFPVGAEAPRMAGSMAAVRDLPPKTAVSMMPPARRKPARPG